METPDVIRSARVGLGLSQAELARKVGVDTRQINRYETGATEPTLAVARRLADQLHISMDELAGAGTPFSGTWWSAWHGLADDRTVTGAVELTQRGHRLAIQPAEALDDNDMNKGEVVWQAEVFVDDDVLLGWYKVTTPDLRARGTLNLVHRNHAVDGDWIKVALTGGSKTGQLVLAPSYDEAVDRLGQVLDTIGVAHQRPRY